MRPARGHALNLPTQDGFPLKEMWFRGWAGICYFVTMKARMMWAAWLLPGVAMAQMADLTTVYERSEGTQTATYAEGIAFYEALADEFRLIDLQEVGLTDSGYPLHLVTYSPSGRFDYDELHAQGYTVLMINNAIHAGEPDGVEASMLLLREVMTKKQSIGLLDSTVIVIIPFYNIGGVLNRNSTTRFNQNGPEEYGFRGNARNYDLNRDFIKADTRNAWSFQEIFHRVDPDLFLDTHVTNGSDHQYVLTLLSTLPNQLAGPLPAMLEETIEPYLMEESGQRGLQITPYVNVHGRVPDQGWTHFYDSPRYSTGYTSLFQTVGFMTETHALKPYELRVEATLDFMYSLLALARDHGKDLQRARAQARAAVAEATRYVPMWTPDEAATPDSLDFRGYRVDTIMGSLTQAETYRYNREAPYVKRIPIRNAYAPALEVAVPTGYYIPRAWHTVVERLKHNGVQVETLAGGETLSGEVYHIADFGTFEMPYEGHYPHYGTELTAEATSWQAQPGDYYVPLNQPQNYYILHVLEPQSRDSFFSWNFFDTILQQKEGPSNYMLEVRVEDLKAAMPDWETRWAAAKVADPTLGDNPQMLMYWLYQNSKYREAAYQRYPIYRILAE